MFIAISFIMAGFLYNNCFYFAEEDAARQMKAVSPTAKMLRITITIEDLDGAVQFEVPLLPSAGNQMPVILRQGSEMFATWE